MTALHCNQNHERITISKRSLVALQEGDILPKWAPFPNEPCSQVPSEDILAVLVGKSSSVAEEAYHCSHIPENPPQVGQVLDRNSATKDRVHRSRNYHRRWVAHGRGACWASAARIGAAADTYSDWVPQRTCFDWAGTCFGSEHRHTYWQT